MRFLVRLDVLALIAFAGRGGAQPSDNGGSNTAISGSHSVRTLSSSSISTSPSAALSTVKPTNGTCHSRTANYITHTLPQQCLRKDRVTANATRSLSSTEVPGNGTYSGASLDSTSAENGSLSREAAIQNGSDVTQADPASSTRVPGGAESTEAAVALDVAGSVEASSTLSGAAEESDSPLDNANFLSFEEWKAQNQAKAEQAAEQPFIGDRQRPVNNALDSLGEEGEIELDFAGFGNGAAAPRQQQAAYRTAGSATSAAAVTAESPTARSKDAGKTCKERTNYASFDCAATVLKTNPECKSAPSVLVENKDSYMLNTCSATNKFFIVELCNDILIDTVVLANYEFFSSIFRHFRVSVSDRYPVKVDRWVDLGTYEASNTREVQAFLIEQPQIWARYLRIEFLTHYGGEYYCPVSLLRVHGKTMLEELRPEEDNHSADSADPREGHESETETTKPPAEEVSLSIDLPVEPPADIKESASDLPPASKATSVYYLTTTTGNNETHPATTTSSSMPDEGAIPNIPAYRNETVRRTFNSSSYQTESSSHTEEGSRSLPASATSTVVDGASKAGPASSSAIPSSTTIGPSTSPVMGKTTATSQNSSTVESTDQRADNQTAEITATAFIASDNASTTGVDQRSQQTESMSAMSQSSINSTRSAASATSSVSPPQPSTQESFFKSIQKRLTQLEANSTLSLQYIEEQSRILRDAFSKVEKRQISATTSFLSNLNDTVMSELRGFRTAYDQIWQSTVLELEGQREQYQREILAISTRLTLVAEELVWQKRMGIVQSILVLLCLGLALFARGGGASYFEVPLMQQMMNKSQTALSKVASNNDWDQTPPASPSPENRSPVSVFRRKLAWRSFTEPGAGVAGAADSGTDSRPASKDGPPYPFGRHMVDVTIQPPTPERNEVIRDVDGSQGIFDEDADDDEDEDGEIFEEVGEESVPPSPEVMRLHRPQLDSP